ncbi:MAG TPA: hypothetical protein VG498_17800 [Terriglobales bacterium]|nr:hypothetical protein [Terriglobales bacterium]
MIFIYQKLLKLYPEDYRYIFADEMVRVFCDAQTDAEQGTIPERLVFYLREITGLMFGAAHERIRQLHACDFKIGEIMDQRSQCRFPSFAIAMMTIVFLIVLELIAKGQGLSHYLFHMYTVGGQHVAGTPEHWDLGKSFQQWPSHYGLLSGVVVVFVLAWTAGLIAWAIAYMLHRTGTQRLEEFPIWPRSR